MTSGKLEFVRASRSDPPAISAFADHTLFQSDAWMAFVRETQGAEPVSAILRDGTETVGLFRGLMLRRFGLRIIGSPLPGWSTAYMGFNLREDISRRDALTALIPFITRELGCHHLELMDRRLQVSDFSHLRCSYRLLKGFEVDLTQSEEELFDNLDSDRRRCIRKATRDGIRVEEATDEGFASDYYGQMVDVFARQALVPTYTIERVHALIKHLLPTGRLLLLRARDPAGRCLATGIFPAMNDTMYFWGGASWRKYGTNRRNEAIHWHAMMYWKSRGMTRYDLMGGGDYKGKYGGREIVVPWLRRSRYPVLGHLRNAMQWQAAFRQKIAGRFARRRIQ